MIDLASGSPGDLPTSEVLRSLLRSPGARHYYVIVCSPVSARLELEPVGR